MQFEPEVFNVWWTNTSSLTTFSFYRCEEFSKKHSCRDDSTFSINLFLLSATTHPIFDDTKIGSFVEAVLYVWRRKFAVILFFVKKELFSKVVFDSRRGSFDFWWMLFEDKFFLKGTYFRKFVHKKTFISTFLIWAGTNQVFEDFKFQGGADLVGF